MYGIVGLNVKASGHAYAMKKNVSVDYISVQLIVFKKVWKRVKAQPLMESIIRQ